MSVIPKNDLISLQTEYMKDKAYYLVKEEIPLEFDKNRNITQKGKADMIINLSGVSVPVSVKSSIKLSDETDICWLQ